MPDKQLTAEQFIEDLKGVSSEKERENIRKFFKTNDADNKVIGVRMKHTFDLAKEYTGADLSVVQKLLDAPYYEARLGAVSILDFKARKKLTDEERKELYDMYLQNHSRINDWGLVDRSAPRVIGGYLLDKPKDVLYALARSDNIWERRTAIVAPLYFAMQGETRDLFKLAEIVVNDPEDLINKATGATLRYGGQRDEKSLLDFLDKHASTMPRITLRYALEKLSPDQKAHYMNK